MFSWKKLYSCRVLNTMKTWQIQMFSKNQLELIIISYVLWEHRPGSRSVWDMFYTYPICILKHQQFEACPERAVSHILYQYVHSPAFITFAISIPLRPPHAFTYALSCNNSRTLLDILLLIRGVLRSIIDIVDTFRVMWGDFPNYLRHLAPIWKRFTFFMNSGWRTYLRWRSERCHLVT